MCNTRINTNKNTNIRKSSLLHPEVSYVIQGCIFEIRNQYRPGHKETVYHKLLEEKIKSKLLKVEREKRISVHSQDTGIVVGTYQPDLLIEDKIIIEVKSS